MVGILPEAGGKGLGLTVSLAALHEMNREGRTNAILRTDDFRVPAVITYLKLCFVPMLIDENQRERWGNIFKGIRKPELIEKFASILTGPLDPFPKPPENTEAKGQA